MSKQYFMTVGYPGGEYVGHDYDALCAWAKALAGEPQTPRVQGGDTTWAYSYVSETLSTIVIRPCPPDLAEWLETEMGEARSGKPYGWVKVPGGWFSDPVYVTAFIPVAGAAGITVLEATDAE